MSRNQHPFFYLDSYDETNDVIILDEDNSRHAVQVLRMAANEELHLTDGKGHLITARITEPHKKSCIVQVIEREFKVASVPEVTIAISPLKNNNRFEWFLEKAAEIGVNAIVPIICARTEKEKTKPERLQNILISAMLQSRQVWLPELHPPISFKEIFNLLPFGSISKKYVAHCAEGEKNSLVKNTDSSIILIGPEGDFTAKEIELALGNGYNPVTLGDTRLRTETAGVVAAVILKIG